MQTLEDFEKWVEGQGGPSALAEKIKGRFGKKIEISQSAISNWIGRRSVSKGKRKMIEEMGWSGPMEWTSPEAEAPDYLTVEKFDRWRVYWEVGMDKLLKRVDDLEGQVRKLSQRATEPS